MSTSPQKTTAVIDLGTNTVLMVVAACDSRGAIRILADRHAIGRLGQGVDEHRLVRPEVLDRVCAILQQYASEARALGAASVRAFGTSVLRDAANRDEVCATVRARTGIDLAVVGGMEEARLTHAGAGFGLKLSGPYTVLDIGGGSTELAAGRAGHICEPGSVDMGAVRCTERYLPKLPPTQADASKARQAIDQALDRLPAPAAGTPLVGVAGTVTTLGALDRGMPRFDAESLNGHVLTAARVSALSAHLLTLDYPTIRSLPPVGEQRADLITAGALILRMALERWQAERIIVSTRGMRYGLLLRELGQLLEV